MELERFCIVLMVREVINHVFIFYSAVQYTSSKYSLVSSSSTGVGDLIVQLVEHCTGITEVMGSGPVRA